MSLSNNCDIVFETDIGLVLLFTSLLDFLLSLIMGMILLKLKLSGNIPFDTIILNNSTSHVTTLHPFTIEYINKIIVCSYFLVLLTL